MANLAAVFQIGSLGDSIVSLPTLLSIRELIPDCKEYLLVTRFDSKLKVLPGDIFEMAWKPKHQLQYAGPDRPIRQAITVPSVLARLRYYRPRYCVSLMPIGREPERVERDIRFFEAGGVKQLRGFKAVAINPSKLNSTISIEGSEAYQRFERVWGDQASSKFKKYARMPIVHPSAAATERVKQWLKTHRKFPGKRLITISPFSNVSSRDIPERTLSALLPALAQNGEAEIAMIGGEKDSERTAMLLAGVSLGFNACGIFSVQESAALLKESKLAICTDSGPMHLAAAVGTPLLVVFSRFNPHFARWLPFGQNSSILYRDVPCAGCFAVQCPVAGHPCMEGISAEHILASAINILNGLPIVQNSLNGTMTLHW